MSSTNSTSVIILALTLLLRAGVTMKPVVVKSPSSCGMLMVKDDERKNLRSVANRCSCIHHYIRLSLFASSLGLKTLPVGIGHWHFHSLWNNLPLSVRSAISVPTFKKYLKIHLFYLASPPPIDTVTPHGQWMLRNCFLDFAVEH